MNIPEQLNYIFDDYPRTRVTHHVDTREECKICKGTGYNSGWGGYDYEESCTACSGMGHSGTCEMTGISPPNRTEWYKKTIEALVAHIVENEK